MLPTIRRCMPLLAFAWTAVLPAAVLAHGCLSGTLADEFTADRMGLVREWIVQIPTMAPGRTLTNVTFGNGLVVAETSDGLVHAIQAVPTGDDSMSGAASPGALLWSQPVGGSGGRLEQAGIGSDLIAVSRDKDVYGLELPTGLPRWRETDRNMAATGAAVIGDWVFSPNGSGMTRFAASPLRQSADGQETAAASRPAGSARRTEKPPAKKGKAKKKRQESLMPSDIETGGIVAYQPVPFEEGVLWCTTDGLLVTLQPTDVEWRRFEFTLDNPPAGPQTVHNRGIFAATTNGDLARIDLPTKMSKFAQLRLTWHAVLTAPADSSAFVAGDTVVVSLGDLGIAAYSAETGSRLWQSGVAGTIVSVGGDRVWLFDRVGRLSSLHLADGMRRETLCLGPFTLPLVNLRDDRLLLASPSGMIVSLVPRRTAAPAAAAPAAGGDLPDADKKTDTDTDAAVEPAAAAEPPEESAKEMAGADANQ